MFVSCRSGGTTISKSFEVKCEEGWDGRKTGLFGTGPFCMACVTFVMCIKSFSCGETFETAHDIAKVVGRRGRV